MSKFFYILLFSILVAGCTDNYSYRTVSFLENNSNHTATLKYYENGNENLIRQVESLQNSIIELYVDANDGKGQGFKAFSFQADSMVLEFDTGAKLIHYGEGTVGVNPDAIGFTEPRNFFYEKNWTFENQVREKSD